MVSDFISLTLTPDIPQHIFIGPIHCLGYTALLKTLHSHFWWDVLPCCYDPLTKKSHWASSFFLLHSKHGSLSRATHYTASLRGLWTVSLPKHVFLRLPVMRLLRLLSNVLSVNPRPASPVCSGPPMAFGFTSLKSLLVLQPLVWNLTVI